MIKEEVDKFIGVRFINEVMYPDWLVNIMLIKEKKRNGEPILTL